MHSILEQLEDEYREKFKIYMEERGYTEEQALRSLLFLGLSFYDGQFQLDKGWGADNADILLRKSLMETSGKYATLKFNFYEMKKDYERMKLQISGLIHENKQYEVSYQHAVKLIETYRKKLEKLETEEG